MATIANNGEHDLTPYFKEQVSTTNVQLDSFYSLDTDILQTRLSQKLVSEFKKFILLIKDADISDKEAFKETVEFARKLQSHLLTPEGLENRFSGELKRNQLTQSLPSLSEKTDGFQESGASLTQTQYNRKMALLWLCFQHGGIVNLAQKLGKQVAQITPYVTFGDCNPISDKLACALEKRFQLANNDMSANRDYLLNLYRDEAKENREQKYQVAYGDKS